MTHLAQTAATLAALDPHALGLLTETVLRIRNQGRVLYVGGNGGSYTTALHIAADLGRFMRVVALGANGGALTAIANDINFADVFAAEISSWAQSGDGVLLISASGQSSNVLRALRQARRRDAVPMGLLGMGGGDALGLCQVAVVVPSHDYGVIEDVHLAIGHHLVEALR